MKNLILFFAIALISQGVFAQYPQGGGGQRQVPGKKKGPVVGYGKITGQILEEESNNPVAFSTIALIDAATNKPVDGTIADDNGDFDLKNIPAGDYKLTISFIGYETYTKDDIIITDKGNTIKLGTVKIGLATTELEEVEVVGQRDLIEEKVDRLVYNAEKDKTTEGGDAVDVLRRVPLLSVDLDGNVSLRGSQNITVLIDNRPSTITAGSIADALKQIPADEIKSVEVITSPSARYDAEGTGGIINIVTKKNNLQGATLNVNSGVGLRGSNLGLNAAYRKGRAGLTLGGWGRSGYNSPGEFENLQYASETIGGPVTETRQHATTDNKMLFGRYNLGWDYEINKYNWITGGVKFGLFNFNGTQDNLQTQTYQNSSLINSSLQDVNFDNLSNTIDVSLNYIKTYEKPRKEFSLLTLYSVNNRTNDFENISLDENNESIINRFKNDNASDNKELTVQLDYVSPISENQTLEVGGKYIMRRVNSNYQYFFADGEGDYVAEENDLLTNVFDYEQNVTAGYLSYTTKFLENYTAKVGARYEYTTIFANFQDEQNLEIPSYGVLVPSINLSRKLKNGNMIKAAYNRRIQRPSIRFLNPNVQASNPKNISQGNPNLDPEYTDNYELSYSTFKKGATINFSAFMRNTNGSIQQVREVLGQDTIFTTYQNIGEEDAYGLSIFTNININKKLMMNAGIDSYYSILNNNVDDPLLNASNEGFVISGRIFGSYSFTDQWAIQAFGFTRGNRVQLQGSQSGFYLYSLGIQRKFKNDRGSIGIGAENFLNSRMKMESKIVSPIIDQTSTNYMTRRNLKLNFSYRIGKLDANPRPRRRAKSIQNDDLKDGGGNDVQENK